MDPARAEEISESGFEGLLAATRINRICEMEYLVGVCLRKKTKVPKGLTSGRLCDKNTTSLSAAVESNRGRSKSVKDGNQKKRIACLWRLCLLWTLVSFSAGCSGKIPVRLHEGLIPSFYPKDADIPHARKGLADAIELVAPTELDYSPSAPSDGASTVVPVPNVATDGQTQLVASVDPRIFYSRETRSPAERLRIFEKQPLGLALEISSEDYPRVEAKVNSFLEECSQLFSESMARSQRYLPMMRDIFKREGLPEDLVYLGLVESGFNPMAFSPHDHVGIWQISKHTGRRFGLRIDHWIDERRDPEKSTLAAARYLKELYQSFQSWDLAIAGYNLGEGKIRAAMDARNTTSFWELCRHPDLSQTTKDFVPRFLATLLIAQDPDAYGLSKRNHAEGWRFDRVWLHEPLKIETIARLAGTTPGEIQALNPHIRTNVTPPGRLEIRVPQGKGEELGARLSQGIPPALRLPDGRVATVGGREGGVVHRVKKGESLGEIARRYGTRVEDIQRSNHLASIHHLKEGQELKIPIGSASGKKDPLPDSGQVIRAAAGSGTRGKDTSSKGEGQATVHKVLKGENLWSIARRYGVHVSDICRWNALKDQRIKPGDVLSLYQ